MMGCEYDGDGGYYLNSYPWILCRTKTWTGYLLVTLGGMVGEVIGLPVFLWTRLRSKNISYEWKTGVYGTYFNIYNVQNFYWEFVVILRRFSIALIVAVIPYNNPMLLAVIVAIINIYLVFQVGRKPYVNISDNVLDCASHVVLLFSVVAGILLCIPEFVRGGKTISLIVIVANFLFILSSLGCLIMTLPDKYKNIFMEKIGNKIMEKIILPARTIPATQMKKIINVVNNIKGRMRRIPEKERESQQDENSLLLENRAGNIHEH